MPQQLRQLRMRLPHTRLYSLLPYTYPYRQRVDEQPHHPFRTIPSLHPSKQHCPKHYILPSRYLGQHPRPPHMTQTRRAHPQLARLLP